MQILRNKTEVFIKNSFLRLVYSFSFVCVLLLFSISPVSTKLKKQNMKTYSVKLKVYDLSRGMVKTWSPILIGKAIEGIWHTAVLVYDMEYFYGGGILCLNPNDFETEYDIHPVNVIDMGVTQVDQSLFHDYLSSIQKNFTAETYNLVHWNCNNFTNEVCNFLVGKGIPEHILNLPFEVMSTSKGKLILDMMQSYQNVIAPGMEHTNSFQNNNNNKNDKKGNIENKETDKTDSKSKGSFKQNKKLPSVSMDNFFDDYQTDEMTELEEIQHFLDNENYNANQKKMFLQNVMSILRNIGNDNHTLQNRILLKEEGTNSPFKNICGIKEVEKILTSLGFLRAFLEIDNINKTHTYIIFLDPKVKTSFSESLELLLNKTFYLQHKKESKGVHQHSHSNHHGTSSTVVTNIIKLKPATDCIPFLEKKNGHIKDLFIHISFPYINSSFDEKHEKNDVTGFNIIRNKVNVGSLDNEKERITKMIEWLNKKINSI